MATLTPEQDLQLVVFQLGDELYGTDIQLIREIVSMTRITRVPRTPAYIKGVINFRGRVLPVIDLRHRLGLGQTAVTDETRIAVVEVDDDQVGMIVDGVTEVLRLPATAVEPASQVITADLDAAYLKGVGHSEGRLIILLDLPRVFAKQERMLR